ncbi:MAG: ribonuclease HII [Chthoniobacteraceae bacterium]
MPCSLKHEKALRARGFLSIAGIDEAGRGPLAGPVVAAAAILPEKFCHEVLRDSKQLTARQRERIHEELTGRPEIVWSVAVVEVEEIDRINILRASHAAMRLAVAGLPSPPDHVLIDGLRVDPFPIDQTPLVKGDALSLSVAAASVIAKVTRDRLMLDYDREYPAYGFAQHKGYGTALHLERLRKHGPCPIHRRSFAPVHQLLAGSG